MAGAWSGAATNQVAGRMHLNFPGNSRKRIAEQRRTQRIFAENWWIRRQRQLRHFSNQAIFNPISALFSANSAALRFDETIFDAPAMTGALRFAACPPPLTCARSHGRIFQLALQ
jgi:hypothetical protein